jgi:type IV pilus assembly protein PilW
MKKKIVLNLKISERGLTLVELLVALVLSLAVLIGLSSVYVAAKQSFRFQETTGRLQEDATFALESIARDLRMTGYAGCPGIAKTTVASVDTYFPGSVLTSGSPQNISGPNPMATVVTGDAEITQQPFTSANVFRGFDSLPASMFSTAPTTTNLTSDSLFFAGGSSNSVSVSAAMADAEANLTIASDPYGWRNASANSGVVNMIVSNCESSSLFKGKVAANGAVFDIQHGTALGNSVDSFASSTQFGAGAVVMPVEWKFYYVAIRNGATTPSLFRIVFDGNDRKSEEEIVSNVESMQLQYGENTGIASGLPTLVVDQWRATASDVTDWSKVVAVRIGLMMVSAEESTSPDITLTVPKLLGESYTKPTGASASRLRKEFSTTVVLRNRVAAR